MANADGTITLYYNEDIREEDGPINTWDEIEGNFDDLIDEEGDINVAGFAYSPSRILQAVDPIAYRCSVADYSSSWEEIDVPMYYYMTDQERGWIIAQLDGVEYVEPDEDDDADDGEVYQADDGEYVNY